MPYKYERLVAKAATHVEPAFLEVAAYLVGAVLQRCMHHKPLVGHCPGMMFTLEVMKVRIGTMSVMALTLASLCGALTCYALTGFSFDIRFMPSAFFDWRTSGWVIALGVFCGLYSVYYNRVAAMLGKFFNRIGNVWLRAAAGSAMAGIALLLFPCTLRLRPSRRSRE